MWIDGHRDTHADRQTQHDHNNCSACIQRHPCDPCNQRKDYSVIGHSGCLSMAAESSAHRAFTELSLDAGDKIAVTAPLDGAHRSDAAVEIYRLSGQDKTSCTTSNGARHFRPSWNVHHVRISIFFHPRRVASDDA